MFEHYTPKALKSVIDFLDLPSDKNQILIYLFIV